MKLDATFLNRTFAALGGRKFLVGTLTTLFVIINVKFGLGISPEQVQLLVGIAIAYMASQGLADWGSGGNTSSFIYLPTSTEWTELKVEDDDPPAPPAPPAALESGASFGSMSALFLCGFLIFSSGCGPSVEAQLSLQKAQTSLAAHKAQTDAGIERCLDFIREQLRAQADEKFQAAVRAETDGGGKINAINVAILQNIRIDHYTRIEREIQLMREYFTKADVNASNATEYLKNLSAYFKQSAEVSASINGSADQLIKTLEKFKSGK